MLTCSIIGATSFTGNELIQILIRHPQIRIGHLTTRSEERIRVRDLIPNVSKSNDLVIERASYKRVAKTSDVIFVTLPHTQAMKTVSEVYGRGKVVIDLSADFRLRSAKVYEQWYREHHLNKKLLRSAVYGLSEIYRDKIRGADLIANPGCYPTGAVLGLYPLVKGKLINKNSIVK